MSERSRGFTLVELLIALALFALLGLASWKLLDGLLRAERGISAQGVALRGVQRAVAVIERDFLHRIAAPRGPGFVYTEQRLGFERANWRNPQDQPRSGRQWIAYRLEAGTLWRTTRSDHGVEQHQALLPAVARLTWRFYLPEHGWTSRLDARSPAPLAVELRFSTGRHADLRRVFLLVQGPS